MDHLKLQEDPESSCRTLAHFLATAQHAIHPTSREMILRDICWRAGEIDPLERAVVFAETCHSVLPANIQMDFPREKLRFADFDILRRERQEHRDVGIVTIIGKELSAVLTALGRAPDAQPDEQSGEFPYWNADIPRSSMSPLKAVVTMVGEARNVPCAIAVERLLNDFNMDAIVLIGIAAGPRSKTKLGDVVCADQVHDYEELRLEVVKWFGLPTVFRRSLPRPKYISPRKAVRIALERMQVIRFERLFAEALTRTPTALLPANYKKDRLPEIHDGTIAAGEKLIADGSLERMLRLDQRIRALDMEDSGFAQVAEFKHIPWCVFRGISDHADPHKENGWQFVAALAAACAALTFLKTAWVPPSPNAVRPQI